MNSLYIDARTLFSSGLGRYLREILTRWPAWLGQAETYFCADASQEEWLQRHRPYARTRRVSAKIYGPGEQLLPLSVPWNATYWVPHYNVPLLCPARLVITVHDAAPLALPDVFNRPAQRLAARAYFGAVRRNAHDVITVSKFSASELGRLAAIPRHRITVIPNGVGTGWEQPERAPERHAARLLFVGNLKPHKNLPRLIEALERVRVARPDLELDIVGQIDGFHTGLEGHFARQLAEAPWVALHGSIGDAELRNLYHRATALVFPSFYEGFGLPLLEAMACGCPVLAANASSLPEIGGSAHGVRYFDPLSVESIAAVIRNFLSLPHAERDAAGAAGPERVRQFSWNVAAEQTLATLLERPLPRHSVPAAAPVRAALAPLSPATRDAHPY